MPRKKGSKNKAGSKKKGQKKVYYICAHDGCSFVVPAERGERLMRKHEARFRYHAQHYAECKGSCQRCQDLVGTGEWTDKGGRDDFMCSHLGCGYYSSSPRAANRKQAVERHEMAFPIHFHHFTTSHDNCGLCKSLLASGKWQPDAKDAWLQQGNDQVIARLTTKEQQNLTQSLSTLRTRSDVVLCKLPPLPPKKKGGKASKSASRDGKAGSSAGTSGSSGSSGAAGGKCKPAKRKTPPVSRSGSRTKSSSTSPPLPGGGAGEGSVKRERKKGPKKARAGKRPSSVGVSLSDASTTSTAHILASLTANATLFSPSRPAGKARPLKKASSTATCAAPTPVRRTGPLSLMSEEKLPGSGSASSPDEASGSLSQPMAVSSSSSSSSGSGSSGAGAVGLGRVMRKRKRAAEIPPASSPMGGSRPGSAASMGRASPPPQPEDGRAKRTRPLAAASALLPSQSPAPAPANPPRLEPMVSVSQGYSSLLSLYPRLEAQISDNSSRVIGAAAGMVSAAAAARGKPFARLDVVAPPGQVGATLGRSPRSSPPAPAPASSHTHTSAPAGTRR